MEDQHKVRAAHFVEAAAGRQIRNNRKLSTMSVVDAFARDFAATMASDAYSNATFVLSLTGLFASLNQVVAHLVAEHVVHGARACFAPHAAWAPSPARATKTRRRRPTSRCCEGTRGSPGR